MADTITLTFDKKKTVIIKGFAIIFMIVLHVFGGAGWYDKDLPMNHNQELISWMGGLKICVGIYTFMVGYGYAFAKQKDFSYSCHHAKKLLIVFWTILLGFALPAGYNRLSGGEDLLLNMFAIKSDLCWVSWFVHFYLWAMIVMPFIGRLIDKKPILFSALIIFSAFLSEVALHQLVPGYYDDYWLQVLFNCLLQTPCMILGYLFSRKHWFQRIPIPRHWLVIPIAILAILLTFYMRYKIGGIYGFNMDFFYAPMIIFCILTIFNQYRMLCFSQVMTELGDKSVYMWFFHGVFFTAATRSVYQPIILISDNLWIISVWTIIITYVASALIKKIVEY